LVTSFDCCKEVTGSKGFETKTITDDGAQRAFYLKNSRAMLFFQLLLQFGRVKLEFLEAQLRLVEHLDREVEIG